MLVLLILSVWFGTRAIDEVYQYNPKLSHVSSQALPLVQLAWVATSLQLLVVVFCRRLPVVAWVVASGLVLVHVVVLHRLADLSTHPVGFAPLVPSDAAALIALYVLTVWRGPTVAVPALLLTVVLAVYATHAHARAHSSRILSALLLIALAVGTYAAGLAERSRSAYLEALRQRAADLDRARVQETQLAVINERSRLAREIHDTVAHALSIVVVQAQGAVLAQSRSPEHTTTALNAIVDVGRGALAEMRTLLSNEAEETAGQRTPLQGVLDVPVLVQQFRAAGPPINLDLPEVPEALPPLISHSVYRIVQESLTNAVKHTCDDVRITVRISLDLTSIAVHVHNSGTRRTPMHPGSHDAGQGLRGMRERVHILGGTLETGPCADGGYDIHACLPIVAST